MPRFTADFIALRRRLNELVNLLPQPSGLGNLTLTQRDADLMSAFVVLAHAACEDFMEARALQVATLAKADFDTGAPLGRVGKHLCIFPLLDFPKDKTDLQKIGRILGAKGFGITAGPTFINANRPDVAQLLAAGFKRFKKSVENNHGAGITYQFTILSKLGFDVGSLGSNFQSRITELARYRGEAAHKRVVAATTIPSAGTLATWPVDLIEGYAHMDVELKRLAKRTT